LLFDPPSIDWQCSAPTEHYSHLVCAKLERPPRS
jgi:hypothetical protein